MARVRVRATRARRANRCEWTGGGRERFFRLAYQSTAAAARQAGTRLCVRERREILQAWWAMWVEEVRGLEERTNTDTLCLAHLDTCRAK